MSGTMTVGCKMASGLFLDLITTTGEGPALKSARTRFATLKGNALDMKPGASNPELVGGYAFTDVDETKFMAWVEQNKDSSIVADRLVIWKPARANALAMAKDHAKVPAQYPRLTEADMKKLTNGKVEPGKNADGSLKDAA